MGFDFFARGVAPELLKIFHHHGIRSEPRPLGRGNTRKGLVIDLGCGSGIWAAELIRAGYEVFGVDQSEAMIRLARKKAPQAKFVRSSYLDVQLPPCDAVTSLGECLCYLFDTKNGIKELTRLFARVYDALRSGGLFLFDIAQPGQIDRNPRIRHFSGADWAVLLQAEEDPEKMILTRHVIAFRRAGYHHYRRSEETHRLRLYWGRDLARILRTLGFRTRVLHAYGKYPLTGNRVAILARKP